MNSCHDCKHLRVWFEYGTFLIDCAHPLGAELFDTDFDRGPSCPHFELFEPDHEQDTDPDQYD
jgi:hypothetical protein